MHVRCIFRDAVSGVCTVRCWRPGMSLLLLLLCMEARFLIKEMFGCRRCDTCLVTTPLHIFTACVLEHRTLEHAHHHRDPRSEQS